MELVLRQKTIQVGLTADLAGERLDRAIARALAEDIHVTAPSVKSVKRWIERGWITRISSKHSERAALSRDDHEVSESQTEGRLRSSTRVEGGEVLLLSLPLDEWPISEVSKTHSVNHSALTPSTGTLTKSARRAAYWERVYWSSERLEFGASIIYHDTALIALMKPALLPTTPTIDPLRESRYHQGIKTLLSLKRAEHERADIPHEYQQEMASTRPYLRAVHRLDRDTSGVVVMARTPEASKSLGKQFEQRRVHKRYWLVCLRPDQGALSEMIEDALRSGRAPLLSRADELREWIYTRDRGYQPQVDPLKVMMPIGQLSSRDGHHMKWATSSTSTSKLSARSLGPVRSAETLIYPLAFTSVLALLEARPLTGRTHQIRVHLSSLGAPLVGDELYGGVSAARMALHARHLDLPHPITQRSLALYAPLPHDFISTHGR